MRLNLFLFTIALATTAWAQVPQGHPTASGLSAVQSTHQDMQKTLGMVPTFVRSIPDTLLPGMWSEARSLVFNPDTAIKPAIKDLISIAVGAQIPCKHCLYWDTEAAKLDGASPDQIQEAVAMASMVRHWSTYLNGMQMDEGAFKKEIRQILSFAKQQPKPKKQQAGKAEITSPEGAYADMRATLGTVPTFLREFPREGVVGAWRAMKEFQMNPATAVSPKDKELIALAVSAQVPCKYCTFFHTEAAKLNGASQQEIHEAVALASMTRQFSTILNGNQIDEAIFRSEAQQILRHIARPVGSPKQMGGEIPMGE